MLDHLPAMANGKQRDSVRTDILNHGIPTLSREADEYFRRIARLSDTKQLEALEDEVSSWLRGLNRPSVSRWLSPPWVYLANIEPEQTAALESSLEERLAERVSDARRRGWEVE